MKTPSIVLVFSAIGMTICALRASAADAPPQSSTQSLVTVTPQALATNAPAKAGFVLKPVGIMKDVQKLTESGADAGVVKAFVQNWSTPYSLTADDVLRLHDAGVPSDVLTAMINRSGELSRPAKSAAPAQAPTEQETMPPAVLYPYPDNQAPEYTQPAVAAPAPTYVYYNYPQYVPYYSPWYSFSYFSYWPYYYYWPRSRHYGYYSHYGHYPYYRNYSSYYRHYPNYGRGPSYGYPHNRGRVWNSPQYRSSPVYRTGTFGSRPGSGYVARPGGSYGAPRYGGGHVGGFGGSHIGAGGRFGGGGHVGGGAHFGGSHGGGGRR